MCFNRFRRPRHSGCKMSSLSIIFSSPDTKSLRSRSSYLIGSLTCSRRKFSWGHNCGVRTLLSFRTWRSPDLSPRLPAGMSKSGCAGLLAYSGSYRAPTWRWTTLSASWSRNSRSFSDGCALKSKSVWSNSRRSDSAGAGPRSWAEVLPVPAPFFSAPGPRPHFAPPWAPAPNPSQTSSKFCWLRGRHRRRGGWPPRPGWVPQCPCHLSPRGQSRLSQWQLSVQQRAKLRSLYASLLGDCTSCHC